MNDPIVPDDSENAIARVVRSLVDRHDADVILFNQSIDEDAAARFHDLLESVPRERSNVFLVLATFGGDAHAAYMIARDLQLRYKKVTLCIAGDCYSAGTLIVLCAHDLVITDRGRLGPKS
jgi:membrane-bound ClpP family serine protease